ncbi:class I adenylate-forming enzyme family protein [Lutimaribacter marinistellae]|uniref:Class I adenylate-forming enzyme family protein n=1 Tax=Lutimaribacter marinistellae TaxID=1820329 RepID=A0ABV7TCL1_9RHOB
MTGGALHPDALRASELTIGSMVTQQARLTPDRVAVQAGAQRSSYEALDRRTDAICRVWQARGVRPGDRVAILSENRSEYIECLVAAAKMGVTLACQNWRLADAELSHCLNLVAPVLLITSPRHAEAAARCGGTVARLQLGEEFEQALSEAPAGAVQGGCGPEDGVVILYTSGTTGLPKGALISHRAEMARSLVQMADLPVETDEAFVAWAPLFHMVSTDSVFATLMTGGKVIVTDGFVPDELAAIVAEEKLGRLTVMPGMIEPFLDAVKQQGGRVAGVRYVGVMADLVPREQIAEITRLLNAPYLNTFGATETGLAPASRGRIPVGEAPRNLEKIQSSLCEIRLVDTHGNAVPDGQPGEMALRTPALFSGYWNNPAANEADFRGGWFHMGDMFIRNRNGSLSFVDRRKYLIKSGGENIYPAEIERVLLSEPRVADAVVVRRSDPQWGEVPIAFIVARDAGVTDVELRALCEGTIARYKIPREFRFVSEVELPRSTTGKIMRHELEERLSRSE